VKILYRQPNEPESTMIIGTDGAPAVIQNCYFKEQNLEQDMSKITKKRHHHAGYEIHMIIDGTHNYLVGAQRYDLYAGQFLLLPPQTEHQVLSDTSRCTKFSITFTVRGGSLSLLPQCGCIPDGIMDNIRFILSEKEKARLTSHTLIGNRVFETILLLFRTCGWKERPALPEQADEDARLTLAKQFIRDNIEHNPTVSDAAQYCYLSTKQLSRLFDHADGISPAEYIRQEKIRHLESLISDSTLSLREISERMHFSSEYYFNTFFRKHYGMPPGLFRKMQMP